MHCWCGHCVSTASLIHPHRFLTVVWTFSNSLFSHQPTAIFTSECVWLCPPPFFSYNLTCTYPCCTGGYDIPLFIQRQCNILAIWVCGFFPFACYREELFLCLRFVQERKASLLIICLAVSTFICCEFALILVSFKSKSRKLVILLAKLPAPLKLTY